MSNVSQSGLGDFLRSRRTRLQPEAVGLKGGRRRRTPGLRREEVAELAGIGVDWYIRLEQGRNVSPSITTVDALARALRLRDDEHVHLRALARNADRQAFAREDVPDGLRRLLESFRQPAYVTGRRWDILAWNAAAADLFRDLDRLPEKDRNIVLYVLTDPGARRMFGRGWAEDAKRIVAQFRAAHDLRVDDPAFLELLGRLREGCPELASWWDAHDVGGRASGRKRLLHPEKGMLTFEYATFQANEAPALKLTLYTPVEETDRAP